MQLMRSIFNSIEHHWPSELSDDCLVVKSSDFQRVVSLLLQAESLLIDAKVELELTADGAPSGNSCRVVANMIDKLISGDIKEVGKN